MNRIIRQLFFFHVDCNFFHTMLKSVLVIGSSNAMGVVSVFFKKVALILNFYKSKKSTADGMATYYSLQLHCSVTIYEYRL